MMSVLPPAVPCGDSVSVSPSVDGKNAATDEPRHLHTPPYSINTRAKTGHQHVSGSSHPTPLEDSGEAATQGGRGEGSPGPAAVASGGERVDSGAGRDVQGVGGRPPSNLSLLLSAVPLSVGEENEGYPSLDATEEEEEGAVLQDPTMTELVGPDDLGYDLEWGDGVGLQDLHTELKTHTMILGRLEAMEQARERLTACMQAMSDGVCTLRSIGPSPTPSCEGEAMGGQREDGVEMEALDLDLFEDLEKLDNGPMGPGYSGSYLALGGGHVAGPTPHAVPSRVGVYRGDRSSFQQSEEPESLCASGWTDEVGGSAWRQQQQRQQTWGAGASEGEDGGWGGSAHMETHLRKYGTMNEHQHQGREYQQPRDAKPRPRGRPPKGSRSSSSAKPTATISKKAVVAASKAHAKAAAKAAKAAEDDKGGGGGGGAKSKKRPVPSSDEDEPFVEEGDDDWDEKRKQKHASKQNDNASIFRGVSRTSRSSWGAKYSSKRICSTGLSEEEAARTYDAFLQRQIPTKYTQYANFCPTCDLFRRPEKEGRKGVKDQRVVVSQGKRYTPCSCALSSHSQLSKKQRGDKGGKNGRKGAGKIKRPSKIEYSHYRHNGEGERGGMTALHLDTAFEQVFGDDNHNYTISHENIGHQAAFLFEVSPMSRMLASFEG